MRGIRARLLTWLRRLSSLQFDHALLLDVQAVLPEVPSALKGPALVSAWPVDQVGQVGLGRVIHGVGAEGHRRCLRPEVEHLMDPLSVLGQQPGDSGVEVELFFVHDERDDVVRIVARSVLLEVRYQILRYSEQLSWLIGGKTAYIIEYYHVSDASTKVLEDRKVGYIQRQIQREHCKRVTGLGTDGVSPEGEVVVGAVKMLLVAVLGLLNDRLNIPPPLVHETRPPGGSGLNSGTSPEAVEQRGVRLAPQVEQPSVTLHGHLYSPTSDLPDSRLSMWAAEVRILYRVDHNIR